MRDFKTVCRDSEKQIMVAAHKGICGGNIPPNTLEAFSAALLGGADIIECDISKCADGGLFMFHPGTEEECTNLPKNAVLSMNSDEVRKIKLHSVCRAETQYSMYSLDEALDFLKGKCYINLDKSFSYLPEVMETVRRHGVEEQILLKCTPSEKNLKLLEEFAPDVNFIAVYMGKDEWTDVYLRHNIKFFGAEVVFADPNSMLASDEYIQRMHSLGLKLWVNAIVFSYKTVLAGSHTDDISISSDPDEGWGWMADRGYDIIQTDWPYQLKDYLTRSGKLYLHNR